MNWMVITWVLSGMGMLGQFLNIYKSPICWLVWGACSAGFSYYNIKKKDYGSSAIWVFYTITDIYGYWVWT